MCFWVIICFISKCIYLLGFLHLDHNMKNEKSKHIEALDDFLLSRNLGTNIEELHTPTLITKNPKKNSGDRKKNFYKVFYKNEVW